MQASNGVSALSIILSEKLDYFLLPTSVGLVEFLASMGLYIYSSVIHICLHYVQAEILMENSNSNFN